MKIDGGCHCGFITYEANADPDRTTICHCEDCQTLTGSAFRTSLRVKAGYLRRSRPAGSARWRGAIGLTVSLSEPLGGGALSGLKL